MVEMEWWHRVAARQKSAALLTWLVELDAQLGYEGFALADSLRAVVDGWSNYADMLLARLDRVDVP